MSTWKYTDTTNTIVNRINADGSGESCLIEAIADWIAEGNLPDPADQIPMQVLFCSSWQIREALTQLGWRTEVENAINAASQTIQDAWHYRETFYRNHPLIEQISDQLGKTPAQLDELFALAITLKL